jgi:hypothetical protein
VEAGVFFKLWQAGVKRFDEICGIEWDWLTMDGAITKAPLGGKKTLNGKLHWSNRASIAAR